MSTPSAVLTKPRKIKPIPRAIRSITISDRTIKGLSNFFDMLADESRLKILLALTQFGEMHVTALCDLLGKQSSQPAVSHHLKQLRQGNLLGRRRQGKHIFYHLESALMRDLLNQFFTDSGNGPKQLHFEEFSLAFKLK